MKPETRANLLFLILFLAISVPGAVILVKKKMQAGAAPMSMPDAVLRRLPYMSPLQTPAEVKRFVPARTGEWIATLARERRKVQTCSCAEQGRGRCL